MAQISWSNVLALAPELTTRVSTEGADDIIAFVNVELDPTAFGGEEAPKLRLARIYLAAHIGRMAGTLLAGPVIAESVGQVSRSYANLYTMLKSQGPWSGTVYAELYNALVDTSLARLPILLGGGCGWP